MNDSMYRQLVYSQQIPVYAEDVISTSILSRGEECMRGVKNVALKMVGEVIKNPHRVKKS